MDISPIKIYQDIKAHIGVSAIEPGSGKLPFAQEANEIIDYANQEARGFKHNYVGTEHLLLGIMRASEKIPCQILRSHGVNPEEVRKNISSMIGA